MDACPQCHTPLAGDEITRISPSQAAPTIITTEVASPATQTDTNVGQLEIGRVLGNRYEIREWIGGGGMGTIYAARRIHIGDTVAVKVLRNDVVSDAQSRERFQREARAAARLHHPNAVVIHDFGQDNDGTTYIVMELLEGESLRQTLNRERSFSPEKSQLILKQACAALEAAHRLGIIHRDIKPDNIILQSSHDGSEHVKILDFGIAKLLDRNSDIHNSDPTLTQVGTVIGTPTYMSPEQCQGETLDARSDVYSLGVVLYEMLTGSQPFLASNSTAMVIKHVTETPRRLSVINNKIPAAIENVVLKALAKKPEGRQQSALDLAREFEQAITQKSVLAAAPANANSAATVAADRVIPDAPAKSNGLKMAALAAGIVLFLALGWGLFSWWRKPAAIDISKQTSVSDAAAALPVTNETPEPETNPAATPPETPSGMTLIVGGDFRMGNDLSGDIDSPSHRVEVKPFFIDKLEVTNEQYLEFIQDTEYEAPPSWKNKTFAEGYEKYPVTDVTWEDATAYAKWAKKRLPTEAEWEYAARGTDERLYPWGNEYVLGMASLTDNSTAEKQVGKLVPVGNFPGGQSPYGLMDMIGNAWEWTSNTLTAYPGGKTNAKPGYQNLHVIRGGSFKSEPKQATATFRRGWPATRKDWPEGIEPDYSTTGFRCAKDVE